MCEPASFVLLFKTALAIPLNFLDFKQFKFLQKFSDQLFSFCKEANWDFAGIVQNLQMNLTSQCFLHLTVYSGGQTLIVYTHISHSLSHLRRAAFMDGTCLINLLPVEGHLGCFQFLAITNSITEKSFACLFVFWRVQLCGKFLEVGLQK